LDHKVELLDSLKGKKRGTHKERIRKIYEMRLSSVGDDCVECKGEMYLQLASGNLMPKAWGDMYHWFGLAIAPKEWREGLASTAPSYFLV